MGNIEQTNKLDVRDGFFIVRVRTEIRTTPGTQLQDIHDRYGKMLATSKDPVLDRDGIEIYIDGELDDLQIQSTDEITYRDPETGIMMPTGQSACSSLRMSRGLRRWAATCS